MVKQKFFGRKRGRPPLKESERRVVRSYRFDPDLAKELRDFCKKTGHPEAAVVEQAVKNFLKRKYV